MFVAFSLLVLAASSERALCTGTVKVGVCKKNAVVEDLDSLRGELIKQNGSCGEMNIAIAGAEGAGVMQARGILIDSIRGSKQEMKLKGGGSCVVNKDTSFIGNRLLTSNESLLHVLKPESVAWCFLTVTSPDSDIINQLQARLATDTTHSALDVVLFIRPASFFITQHGSKQPKTTSIISYIKSFFWYPSFKINSHNVKATVTLLDTVRELNLVNQPVLIVTGLDNVKNKGMFPHIQQALLQEFPEVLFCERSGDGVKKAMQALHLLYVRKYIAVVDVVRELTEVYREVVERTGAEHHISELSHISASKEIVYQQHLEEHRRNVMAFESAEYHNKLTSYATIAAAAVVTLSLFAMSAKLLFPVLGKLKELGQDFLSLGIDDDDEQNAEGIKFKID